MKLYHGTNGAWLSNILKVGLEPRRQVKSRNNWTHLLHQSNPNAVYLTDSYAPYFAFNAVRGNNPSCAVIEVDTDLLDEKKFSYDEDCWEQLGRQRNPHTGAMPQDGIEGTMSQRTLYWRKQQKDPESQYKFLDNDGKYGWVVSLRALGTCCYLGDIPPHAITRAVKWPHRANGQLIFVWDPTITLLNQQFHGKRYKLLTQKLFGDTIAVDGLDELELRAITSFDPGAMVGMERFQLKTSENHRRDPS
jgi:hypothetical protein